MIGKTIFQYEVIEKLGEGGMSQNHPRTRQSRESSCDFADPAVFTFFVSRFCLSGWRDSKYRRYR